SVFFGNGTFTIRRHDGQGVFFPARSAPAVTGSSHIGQLNSIVLVDFASPSAGRSLKNAAAAASISSGLVGSGTRGKAPLPAPFAPGPGTVRIFLHAGHAPRLPATSLITLSALDQCGQRNLIDMIWPRTEK